MDELKQGASAVDDATTYKLRSRLERRRMLNTTAMPALLFGAGMVTIALILDPKVWEKGLLALCILGAISVPISHLAQRVRWFCPGCGKLLHQNEPWRCGFCGSENRRKSILDRCGNPNCETAPKAFECSHSDCYSLTYFTEDRDGRHPARTLNPKPQRTPPAPREAIRTERAWELEDREHE